MAAHYERSFIQHLCIPESLKEIIERDLPADLLPSDDLLPMFDFAQTYWHTEGRDGIAPTPEVMDVHFSNLLAEHEIDLTIDPEGTLEWSISVLQGAYIDRQWQPWVREFTMKISGPDVDHLGKADALDSAVEHLMSLQSQFTRRSEHVDLSAHGGAHLDGYDVRAANRTSGIRGALLGLEEIDIQMGGVRPGELLVVAGPPKSGKSFMLLNGAWHYWLNGGTPVLVTLENSVEMTLDRLACMRAAVDSSRWERGECTPEEMMRIAMYREQLASIDRPFHILQPEPGKRTIEHLIRRARTLGDAVYIDQLTFIEPSIGTERKPKHQQIGDLLHEGKALAGSGRRIPLVIAHQINREGVKAAEKTGHLEMYHLAESAEVERTADRVLGLWQSSTNRDVGRAWVQTLASRRSGLIHWEIEWQPFVGRIGVRGEIDLPEVA